MDTRERTGTDGSGSIFKSAFFILPACVVLLVAGRGLFLANMISGRYSLSSFLFDAFAAVLILLLLQCGDYFLTSTLQRLIGKQSKARQWASKLLRLLVVGMVFGTFLLVTVQMHPPKVSCRLTPAQDGMEFSSHTLTTDDGIEIDAWLIPGIAERPTVVVTHGLGANKQNFLHIGRMFHELGYNVVMYDFRAHGDSQGHTCTLGVQEAFDSKAAFDFAQSQFPDQPIFGWSTSLGGAATLRASAEFGIFDKLVVDATFSSVENVAMDTKFCYAGPAGSAIWNLSRLWFAVYSGNDIGDYGPIHDIKKIDGKRIMLIHGTKDSIIPCDESRKLHAANSETELWVVDGAGHSGSFVHCEYSKKVQNFFEGTAPQFLAKTTR